MKENRLRITGVEDFVIISPRVLGMILQKISESRSRMLEIPVGSIMPPGYTQYLVNVLNSNRENKLFKFSQIKDDPIRAEHVYQIIQYQMQRLKIESEDCFQKIVLCTGNTEQTMEYEVEAKDSFFCICKNENSRFIYVFPNGKQESVLVECKNNI